jgi:glucose/arabinose dehydrogenase
MAVTATRAAPELLRKLPTTARPVIDPADIEAPDGYVVEPVLVGLSFPCGMGFADDGSLFLLEGGSTWPTRPYMPARILRLDTASGALEEFAVEVLGGPRGVAYKDGAIYVSVKGGYHAHVDRYDLTNRRRTVVVDGLPSGGWHEPSDLVFGPDGLLYFGNGSVSQNGVILPQGFTVDVAKHPEARDVPGQDVTLTGNNVWSRNPTTPFPFLTETGPFKPFGTPARKGEVVKGQLKCSSGLWRCRPDGSGLELLAWGLRNPYGLALSEDGELYASDNDYEEKGERAIADDPDRIWHIKNARTPHGSVTTPDWYGFPDFCGDGLPAWHEKHQPRKGKPAEPLLENPPPLAGRPVYLERPHTCMTHMEFCQSDAFGHRGELFLSQFGTYAPLNTPDPTALTNGFRVLRVDVRAGTADAFLKNRLPGPASAHPGTGGLERPVDCKFHPDGRSLYVLDFGVTKVAPTLVVAYARTGVVWRVTRV